ncbi:MAG: hypothetical protein KC731_30905 [Myxococcales bacterium]|nr:hypothetical protein [Myxococcales bacterium]
MLGRRWLILLIAMVAIGGCECGRKSDEEILRERIDTLKVHLYLATKIAIVKADQSPDAKAAHDALLAALEALRGTPSPPGAPASSAPGAGGGAPARTMTAEDALKLVKALHHLRGEGKALLESGDEKGLQPFLPVLFEPHSELAAILDLNMEHALLLTGGFLLKFHPKNPLPIPPEVLLYEAWMTDSTKLLPGLSSLVQLEKAIIYGTNELCDLAAREAKAAKEEGEQAEKLLESMGVVAGTKLDLQLEQARQGHAGIRAIAFGATAVCYKQRGEQEKAVDALDETLDALEATGVPPGELGLVRAYVAFERGDHAEAKKQLEIARDHPGLDPDSKKDIVAILDNLEDDPNVFEAQLGKAFFTVYLAKIILRTLDRAGVFDELKRAPVVTTIDGFLTTTVGALEEAKKAVPSGDLLDRAKRLVSGEEE